MAISHFTPKPQFSSRPSERKSRRGLRKRCFLMVKQQKTRFYILGRYRSITTPFPDGLRWFHAMKSDKTRVFLKI